MRQCAHCGTESPAQAAFYMSCGTRLPAATPRPGTRKSVTVVFCDVTGSTQLGERLDLEALRMVIARYVEQMRSA